MVPPVWAIPIGVAFVVMSVMALRRKRGRVFYALTGMEGLVSGIVWLDYNVAAAGYGKPHLPSMPAIPLSEAIGRMFSFGPFGHPLSSILACVFCVVGLWFCIKTALGRTA